MGTDDPIRDEDDEALSWDGDGDPTLDVGAARAGSEPVALPDGFTAVGKGSDRVGRLHADGSVTMPGRPQPMGNATLVTLGVVAGVYVLYSIGWVIGGLRLAGTAQYLVDAGAYQIALWLAVAAPLLWFVTAYALTRHSRVWLRLVWLIAGVVLFIPWPFIMTGAVGQ
ncbi:DNA polymerase III subunit gamma/tau [Microbacterium sp.]|uniref:DNA polymerase III subunit gamma/tau n=1 Tax=Microbacterium sp. TaxID=51671 RepID=UPI0039E4C753